MIKYSPHTRKNIMKDNDGYVYIRLSRFKSSDHFFLPQCYLCYNFNHSAAEFLDKDMVATCDKCDGRHINKNCNRNSLEQYITCVQNRERNFKHDVFSREGSAVVKARAFIIWKTDLDGEKNGQQI